MSGLRGVRPTRSRSKLWAALRHVAPAATLVLGCTGDRIVVGGQVPPSLSSLGSPDAGDARDGGADRPGIGVPAECPESPGERRQLLGCWPTRQVGSWQGFFLGIPHYETPDGEGAEFPLGDVVMRFGVDGAGSLSVGASSDAPGCEPRGDAQACADVGEVLAGFEYRLGQVRLQDAGERGVPQVAGEPPPRAGELMSFEIRLGEPWDASCSSEAPCEGGVCPSTQPGGAAAPQKALLGERPVTCRCGSAGCVPEAPTLAMELTMSEDGRALRGAYLPRDRRFPEVGLELVRVEPP